jgi:hypothetical protein
MGENLNIYKIILSKKIYYMIIKNIINIIIGHLK